MPKKNKKGKPKDLDINIGEYDEEQEKKDRDKTLAFIKMAFSLTNNEMNDLLNYDFLDEDLRDFDRLASILIERQEKEREEEEEKKEKEKEKKDQIISEESKVISKEEGKKSKLREYLESIDKKDDMKDIDKKMSKPKTNNSFKGNFSIKEAEEFLESNKNKTEIDLHGKRLIESMYIVHNKIISLKEKKSEECLKEITLTIITGVGNHSIGHQPVLFPNLTMWLKNKRKYKVDEKSCPGNIFVTIY